MNRIYPSKLILFGEYSLILGSQVLGIPLRAAYGYWSKEIQPNSIFKEGFIEFLCSSCADFLYVEKLKEDQLYYNSNIKRGYGTGSSGALAAAIFDYCKIKEPADLHSLQQYLGKIESFFHGKSSGFDPLISFLNKPILKSSQQNFRVIDTAKMKWDLSRLYLFDSGEKRTVKGLVPLFVQKAKVRPDTFEQLVDINNELINAMMQGAELKTLMKKLSQFQLSEMSEMITDKIKKLWIEGLRKDEFYMKICGAGGGGYYMIYLNQENSEEFDWSNQLVPIDLS